MWEEYNDVGDDVANTHQQPDEGKAGRVTDQKIYRAGEEVALNYTNDNNTDI